MAWLLLSTSNVDFHVHIHVVIVGVATVLPKLLGWLRHLRSIHLNILLATPLVVTRLLMQVNVRTTYLLDLLLGYLDSTHLDITTALLLTYRYLVLLH